MKITRLAVSLILITAEPCFAAPELQTGLWEMTSQVEINGAPVPFPPVTNTQCITEQRPDPEKILSERNCQFSQSEDGPNSISWQISCLQQGVKVSGKGVMQYQKTTFIAKFDLEMGGEAGAVTMSTIVNGHYVGDCQSSGE